MERPLYALLNLVRRWVQIPEALNLPKSSVGLGKTAVTIDGNDAIIWRDGDCWRGQWNDFPDYETEGKTQDEVSAMLVDLREYLEP